MYTRRAFTLIELLLFSAIFAVVIVVFVGVLISTTRIQVKLNAQAEVSSQSTFVLQSLQRYVEQSSLIEAVTDTPSSTIKLRMASSSLDPTVIYLSSGTIYIQQGTSSPVALTSNRVNVTNLTLTKHSNPVGHDTLSLAVTLSYNAPNTFQTALQGLNLSVTRVSAATFDSNILPASNNTYKIGLNTQDWQSINNTIFFGSGGTVGIGYSNPGSTSTNALVINGNVGIGTTAPGSLLDLAGALTFRGMSAPSSSAAGQAVLYYDTSSSQLKLSTNAGAFTALGGGSIPTVLAKTANYTVSTADGDVVNGVTIDCTSGTFTVTLYAVSGNAGRSVIVKDSGAGTITVAANATETIDGLNTYTLSPYDSVTLQVNAAGSAWNVL